MTPTSARSLSSRRSHRSAPGRPRSARRGARLVEVAKRALPRPPRAPPPSPPSPPSGPPRGTYFSRRKLTQPAPPSPPLTKISVSSTNIPTHAGLGAARRRSRALGSDAHVARVSTPREPDVAVHLGEQCIVRAQPHVETRLEARAALADEDGAAGHELSGEALDAKH